MFSSSRSNSTVKPSPLAEPTTLDEHEHTEEPEELMESDRASIASIAQEIQLDPEPIPAIHEPPASPVEPPTESAFSPDEDHFLAQQPAFPLEGTVKMVPKPSILATADLFAGDVGNTVKRAGSTRTNELEGTIRQPRRASSFWRLFKEREAENGMAESFAETDDRRVTVVMPDDVYVDALSETPQQEEPSVMMFDPNLNIGTIGKGMGRKLSSRHQQTLTDTFTESPVQTQPPPNAFVAENDSYGTVRKRGATVPVDSRTVLSTPKIQLYPNFHADASAQDPKFHETDDEEDALESEAKAAEEIITEARAKDTARNIYDETNMPAKREEICEWLGKNDEWRQRVLRNYLDCFEFGGMRLDEAFRRFTGHLYLKGETQLIDRILVQFARRFYDCNRNGLFDNQDVVYGVAYSLLLLNTDLHVAQNNTKMSRSTFVRNTLATITAYTNVDVKVSEDTQKRQSLDTRSFSVDTRSISSKSVGSDKSGKNDLATMLKVLPAFGLLTCIGNVQLHQATQSAETARHPNSDHTIGQHGRQQPQITRTHESVALEVHHYAETHQLLYISTHYDGLNTQHSLAPSSADQPQQRQQLLALGCVVGPVIAHRTQEEQRVCGRHVAVQRHDRQQQHQRLGEHPALTHTAPHLQPRKTSRVGRLHHRVHQGGCVGTQAPIRALGQEGPQPLVERSVHGCGSRGDQDVQGGPQLDGARWF
jgi:hypothetical protein